MYDFVTESEDEAMQNHMEAYRSVLTHTDQALDGTIIRIPLRTSEQVSKSEISDRETTVAEITEVLRSFASEFGANGLLFMKNVETIEIRSVTMLTKIELTHRETVRA